jgi:hypothetical protein
MVRATAECTTTASRVRVAAAARIRRFCQDWDVSGDARAAYAELERSLLGNEPVVVDAVRLQQALADADDDRWRLYVHDRSDPATSGRTC